MSVFDLSTRKSTIVSNPVFGKMQRAQIVEILSDKQAQKSFLKSRKLFPRKPHKLSDW